jgi:RNA polymerase sigma factor (sigma-70 family)
VLFVFLNMKAEVIMQMEQNRRSEAVVKLSEQLFGFIRKRVNSKEDAEDVLQDVWFQFSNFSGLESLENASAWLFRVARNRITDLYRKRKTNSLEDFSFVNEEGETSFRSLLLAVETEPELGQFKNIFWEQLMEALHELPEKQREVFVQNELENKTLQEIADQSGENLKTIISRKGYAIKHLRVKLSALYEELNS